ncbi:MAG: MoaD/ThiS family protein [Desulfobacteraceae bacterium]|jgi:sulfur carrier protein ThiS
MRLKVKLFSILREYAPDYDPDTGLEVELASDALVSDLIHLLNIPSDKAPVVSCNGRVMKADEPLRHGSVVHLFQPVAGG